MSQLGQLSDIEARKNPMGSNLGAAKRSPQWWKEYNRKHRAYLEEYHAKLNGLMRIAYGRD